MSDEVAVRPAATVALLRDTHAGLEVFMLRRHARQVFAASHYVYPGGAVDAVDRAGAVQQRYVDAAAKRAAALLDDAQDALAYWVAAVRECFEEAGVLLGCEAGHPLAGEALVAARDELNAGTLSWTDLAAHMDLRFDLGKLHYFAFWTTPPGMPRRFSTRFFAARMPAGQRACADGSETTRGEWMRPQDALARHQAGEVKLMPPTTTTLRQLADYTDVDAALADMKTRPITPHP